MVPSVLPCCSMIDPHLLFKKLTEPSHFTGKTSDTFLSHNLPALSVVKLDVEKLSHDNMVLTTVSKPKLFTVL